MANKKKDEEYERLLEQAITKIAVYSDEWTNRLPSDPGITVLENLTAFQLLLLQKIRSIPETLRPILPGLLGIEALRGVCARVLLGAYDSGGARSFARHEKFCLGNLCFETAREINLPPGRMRKVYRKHHGQFEEIEELRAGNPLAAPIFGQHPQPGDEVYLLFDGPYAEAGGEVRLYVNAQPAFPRNPPDENYPVLFAKACWSYYTEDGFKEAECTDETNVFLKSGELSIRLGTSPPAIGNVMGEDGYLLKCGLLCEEYDQIPWVKQIEGPLFEVYEMDSKAVSYELPFQDAVKFLDKMRAPYSAGEERYLFTFIGNKKEGYWGVQQTAGSAADIAGRADESGSTDGTGSTDTDGCRDMNASAQKYVKIVSMNKEMAVQMQLGTLYGYDNQEFKLSLQGEPVPDSLEIMAVKSMGGEQRSYFFSPMQEGTGDVVYEYDSQKKAICILDAGDYEGCQVFISSYAIFHGADGNVLPGNRFLRVEGSEEETYYNPVCGQGGRKAESLEETVVRMQEELAVPGALVTAADYEQAAARVPGLCIHKVHACRGESCRAIHIFVKPYAKGKTPLLPKLYVRQIQKYLEDRRLLGTEIHIDGPEYIAVDVYAAIAVKVQYADAKNEIEKTIRKVLDDMGKEQGFCGTVPRSRVLQALKNLPCIEYIEELALSRPGNQNNPAGQQTAGSGRSGMDIRLPEGGLCYAGEIKLMIKRSSII